MKTYDETIEIPHEMIALWELSLEKEEVVLDFDRPADANSMRQRLYTARKTLVKGRYARSVDFSKKEISKEPLPNGGVRLTIRTPAWLKVVGSALKEAGKELPASPPPEAPELGAQEELTEDQEMTGDSELEKTIQGYYGTK